MRRLAYCLLLVTFLVGCDDPPSSSVAAPAGNSGPPRPGSGATAADGPRSAPPTPSSAAPSAPAAPQGNDDAPVEREVVSVGADKRGRNYGGGVISEPIRQYFRAGQRIQLLNLERAMKLYKGEHGKLPTSHEQFMKEIVEANSLELPQLPEGERYVYDPQQGQLMVERPSR